MRVEVASQNNDCGNVGPHLDKHKQIHAGDLNLWMGGRGEVQMDRG